MFICEGEEELGSPRLAAFCDAHRDELAGDFALDFDLQEQPGSIFAGVKGIYDIELSAGGGPDIHSSRVAEVAEPAIDLARAVLELKEAVPAANVAWMLAGTPEDVSRTVVPGTARAGVDIRFDEPCRAARALERRRARPQGDLPARALGPGRVRRCGRSPRRCAATGPSRRCVPRAPWWAPYHVFGDIPFASGGPGSAGGAHGPDEWAEIQGLRRLMHVAYDALALL